MWRGITHEARHAGAALAGSPGVRRLWLDARRYGPLLASSVGYAVAVVALLPVLGPSVTALAMIPVLTAAWTAGTRAGLVATLATVLVTFVLFKLMGHPMPRLLDPATLPGPVAMVTVAIAVGRLHALSERVRQQVAAQAGAEEALRRGERDLATTLDSIGDGVIATDAMGRVVRMNPAAERMTGWKREDAQGLDLQTVFEVVHPETRLPSLLNGDASLRTSVGAGAGQHAILIHRSGVERHVDQSVTLIRDAGGGIPGVVVVFRDTTAERQTRTQLARSERELRKLIETLPDGVAIQRQGKLVYANPALVRALGYESAGPLIGRSLADLLHPDERAAAAAADAGRDPASAPATRARRFVDRRGSEVVLEVSPERRIVFEGAPSGLCVARDVTERHNLQARLLLTDRMASVGTLAAGVAHELNNPIAYVLSNLEYLAESLPRLGAAMPREVAQEWETVLRDCRGGARRVRDIVRDLKTFSRADDARDEPVRIDRVLETSLNMAGNEIRHRARLVRDFRPAPPVRANESRLGQVFVNLLVNAAQAIPEGAVERNEIRVSVGTDAAGRVVVEVRDTGVGIAPEVRSRIFDPFFTTKEVGVGTGLGLSICHNIVTSIGGEIAVESAVGAGTTFRIVLPACAPAELPTPERRSEPVRLSEPRARVLVVDDEVMVAEALRRALRGHEVTIVTSGRDAIERLRTDPGFDVVFCDLMMPDVTGMDVYDAVRVHVPGAVSRIVFMTGGTFTPRAREFRSTVPNTFVDKPFDLRALRALIRERVTAAPRPVRSAAPAARASEG